MSSNYAKVFEGLKEELAVVDLAEAAPGLGGKMGEEGLELRCLGRDYRIHARGIILADGSDPAVAVGIVLCHYALQRGRGGETGKWVSYRDFRDSSFFMSNFQANVEGHLARRFKGRVQELKQAAAALGGRPREDLQWGDACIHFQALPRIPLLLVFYDGDEEFSASCKLLFDRSAPLWLDMECLAALGGIVAELLLEEADKNGGNIP